MTPRQLHSFMWLRKWRRDEELAELATALRVAPNTSADDFKKYIDSLTK